MTYSTSVRILSVRGRPLSVLLALAFLTVGAAAAIDSPEDAAAASVRHLALKNSVPAADESVGGALKEIRLFFTEVPQVEGTSIRIADDMNELVASSEAAADGGDPSQVFIQPESALVPGAYTVHWRAIAQDGHAVNGDFGFQVATE